MLVLLFIWLKILTSSHEKKIIFCQKSPQTRLLMIFDWCSHFARHCCTRWATFRYTINTASFLLMHHNKFAESKIWSPRVCNGIQQSSNLVSKLSITAWRMALSWRTQCTGTWHHFQSQAKIIPICKGIKSLPCRMWLASCQKGQLQGLYVLFKIY